jgi:hypothetical protein
MVAVAAVFMAFLARMEVVSFVTVSGYPPVLRD